MSDYLQPDFYRFNQDSFSLIHYVKNKIPTVKSLLDLGAGSGVIGLELGRHFRPSLVTFVEIQKDFLPFLSMNISHFLPEPCRSSVFAGAFSEFYPDEDFDIIVANPPYYLPHAGQPAQDGRRDTARSFKQDNWKEFLHCIERSLAPAGRAFIVIKNDPMILKEAQKFLPQELEMVVINQENIVIIELFRLDINRDENFF